MRAARRELVLEQNRTARVMFYAGRPVDCLGLTKRWSLKIAWPLRRTPGLGTTYAKRIQSNFTGRVAKDLRATALSLSHLTWS